MNRRDGVIGLYVLIPIKNQPLSSLQGFRNASLLHPRAWLALSGARFALTLLLALGFVSKLNC
jgi:hypothetical protein